MIAKGKAIAHGSNAINYALREDKRGALYLRGNLVGSTPGDMLWEFEAINGEHTRCKNKYLRFEIGIAPQDETRLTPKEYRKIVAEFVKRMGLADHQ